MKNCNHCGVEQTPENTYVYPKGHFRKTCRVCTSILDRMRNYDISEEEVKEWLEVDKCQICDTPVEGKGKHMDHCHETGRIRGILCVDCNRGVTLIEKGLLESALTYLGHEHDENMSFFAT